MNEIATTVLAFFAGVLIAAIIVVVTLLIDGRGKRDGYEKEREDW